MKVQNRIKKQQDFSKIINTGKFLRTQPYSIYFTKNELNYIRVGISIPRKTGNAVVRNKTKRQINAMLLSIIKLDDPFDLIIVPRKEFKNGTFESNQDVLSKMFENIRRTL